MRILQSPDRRPRSSRNRRGFRNFESFLVHYWMSGDAELCDSLIDAACEDLEHCPEVVEQGWSMHDAAVHYVAESLRDFAAQEACANSNADPEITRQTLDRIEWREIATALLSYE